MLLDVAPYLDSSNLEWRHEARPISVWLLDVSCGSALWQLYIALSTAISQFDDCVVASSKILQGSSEGCIGTLMWVLLVGSSSNDYSLLIYSEHMEYSEDSSHF